MVVSGSRLLVVSGSRLLVVSGRSEDHQSPSDSQHSEEKPDQPDLTKQTNHKDSQKAENFPETKKLNTPDSTSSEDKPNPDQPEPESVSPTKLDQNKLDPVPAGQQKLRGSLKLLQSDHLCGHQKNPGIPLGPKHKQQPGQSQDPPDQRDLCLPDPEPEEDPRPPPPSKDSTALSSTLDKQIQKELKFHVSKSKDLQNLQDAPTENLTSAAHERDQDHQDSPHLNTQQAPPSADLQTHLCPPTVSPAPLTPPLTMEAFCDQVHPDLAVPSSGEPRLCGYLQKQGGPLRAWKQRWFTYEEKKNQLFYYRTPQDVTPLGRVELSGATFTYPLKAEKGTFHIKTPERTFVLKELVWILHKALEAAQLEKRTCAEFLAEEGEQERLELLRHRERQAADLRGRLDEANMEAEAARRSLAQRDLQLAELQDNVRMLTEKNNAKKEVRMKFTAFTASHSFTFLLRSRSYVRFLHDDIEAYKTQNKFLNSEIHQLTKLWRKSSEQEKSLLVKCAYLEATNCQAESRYLGVLRKLQEAKSLDPAQQEAVQKMIEDALRGELKSVTKLSTDRDHDEYGFKIIPDYEVEDMKLLAKIQALEIRSHNLLHQNAVERPLLSRWAHYLAGRSEHDLCPSPELKVLLRGGVPREYRQRVWRWMVRQVQDHLSTPLLCFQLCEKSRTSPHPASRQIQLDLHRTLTTNQHFSSPSSPALQQLRRVLLAFSWQNPAIGYCQGLNRLAAIALLVLQSEEDAFWCLVTVVEAIMPQDYYTKNLVASQADQRVLKDFMAEKLPRLMAHFEDHSIDVSLITFNWFLVVFVESLPSDILLPLWDAFLYEGTKVIFRYALALFKYKEDDILKIHDSVEIYQYLRFFTKTISNSRRLTSIAFSDMNPFPRRLLRNRRMLHLERLQGELRELEEQQREFVTESAERKDKELDIAVSEDDDEL
uniref:TBC1 domain family, member 2 n=1 Tax=Acanthochromis polyacanthus TaxID=80966 RepID=A0A3Q1GKC0_9TELE